MPSSPWRWLDQLWNAPSAILFFRNVGAAVIALVLCLVPSTGPNRFWIASILVFVCIPAATWIERHSSAESSGWMQPLFDLGALVTLVHFVPSAWFPALVIGLMVVQAPSVSASRSSTALYALFAAILTLGMTFAAVVHDVEGWQLPIVAMVGLYPSVIYYAHRQARIANAMRERAKALDGLHLVAGGVAHDFNNVLTSVLGYAELAAAELPAGHPAGESLEEVIRGSERASLLAGRLLAFSGRGATPSETLDVAREVASLIDLLRSAIPRSIALEVDAQVDAAHVRAQRVQLQQVVMNLILNASEANPAPSRVRVAISRAAAVGREGEVRIEVADDGGGIPPELHERIFDPFFTLKEQGHGLGLATARAVVRELGGRIAIASDVGLGTRVAVELPAASAPSAPSAPSARARASASERSMSAASIREPARGAVLVVDDEANVRGVLARMLEGRGHRVLEAASGEEAVAIFLDRGDDVALVVLDIRMPGMDGWECLHALRSERADLPVLICSGHDPFGGNGHARDPQTGFLPKPVRASELERALDAVQQRS